MHVVAAQAAIPRDRVGADLLVRVADVRLAVRVVDRRRQVELCHLRRLRSACVAARRAASSAACRPAASAAIAPAAAPSAPAMRPAFAIGRRRVALGVDCRRRCGRRRARRRRRTSSCRPRLASACRPSHDAPRGATDDLGDLALELASCSSATSSSRSRRSSAIVVDRDSRASARRTAAARPPSRHLVAQLGERDRAQLAVLAAQRHALAEDVVRDDLLLALRRANDPAFLRKALAALHVELVLVAQAAHQPPARAGDLRRIERQPLILRDAEVHGTQLGQPRRRAVLAAAAADAVEPLGFVAHADLLQLDARAEHRRELAHERAEVDALLGREVERQLLAIPLPLGVGQLHDEVVRLHALHRACGARPRRSARSSSARSTSSVVARRRAFFARAGGAVAVRRAGVALLRELADGMHVTEILPAVGVDDHRAP